MFIQTFAGYLSKVPAPLPSQPPSCALNYRVVLSEILCLLLIVHAVQGQPDQSVQCSTQLQFVALTQLGGLAKVLESAVATTIGKGLWTPNLIVRCLIYHGEEVGRN